MLALLLMLLPARAAAWPDWQLPAPLQPAGHDDLLYPNWFAGNWLVRSHDSAGVEADLTYRARFAAATDQGSAAVVGDRAFNAKAVGQALLQGELLGVENDPNNPNRQLARLRHGVLLESTVVAREASLPTNWRCRWSTGPRGRHGSTRSKP